MTTSRPLRPMPEVELVRDGLWSIPVPIPQNSLAYVLVYAFELDDGIAIVDAGWDTDEAWTALVGGLETIGASVSDVRSNLITHIHPDHFGLAGRVRDACGGWIGMHEADAALIGDRYANVDELLSRSKRWLADAGVPGEFEWDLRSASLKIREMVSAVQPDRLIADGERVDVPGWDLRAVWTPGHSPGHLCFVAPEARLLLTGDHVLPHITPNVSVHPQSEHNPLGDYLNSLRKLAAFDPDEVLPAHESRFTDLHRRLRELVSHHLDRLEAVQAGIEEGRTTAWELAEVFPWSRPWADIEPFMRRAAVGELLAHVRLLEEIGLVEALAGPPTIFRLKARSPGPEIAARLGVDGLYDPPDVAARRTS
ncbi:MAG: MBL fold metallo-hydrolase [Acidimicrobiales bacterium]|nr:MBL fold metallo-hydrolase [Acidimicrobiales bacterium]